MKRAPKKSTKTTPPLAVPPSTRRSWRRGIAVLCLVGAFVCGAMVLRFHHAAAPVTAERESDYIDPAVCATCHAEIAATYRKTGMGRSFYRPTANNVIEDYAVTNKFDHKSSGMQYQMIERDGKFFQRRNTIGFDGKEANVVEEQVDYIVGSGNHARTYLHRNTQGRLIELPVSWYTEHSGHWAMSPSFDNPNQKDMRLAITPECMFCHNGYPELNSPAAISNAEEAIFPDKLPEGIDCQRCHGPGRAHVKLATSAGSSFDEIRHAIVNPQKLPRDRQLEVCMECHLGTNETHTPSEIRNYQRTAFSFRPGESLGDYKQYFEAPLDPSHQDFGIAHAAYRLQQSQCFLKSKMTCITCHNPHDIPRGEEATRKYTAICQSCHTEVKHTVALPASETCLSCHMPKRRSEGSVNVIMTDHYIQRNRPLRDLLAPMTEKVMPPDMRQVDLYYPRSDSETQAAKLYLAVARVDDGDGREGLAELQRQIESQSPAGPKPYLELGRAYERRSRHDEAVRWFDAALAKKPDDLQALQEIAPALIAAGQRERAIELLKHAVALYPKDDLLLTDLGYAYLQMGKLSEAQEASNLAVAANPEHADAFNLRGLVALRRGDTASAERDFRESIRWQPNLVEAQNNLGLLLLSNRSLPEAEFHLTNALKINPNYADAHHTLGMLYVLANSIPRADAELRKAAELQPNSAEIHSDLADLLATEGLTENAATEYEHVLKLDPNRADAQLGLGLAYLKMHRPMDAKPHLELAAASNDQEVARVAAETLQKLER
jgi:predicted CXXCH cytochrome family protein